MRTQGRDGFDHFCVTSHYPEQDEPAPEEFRGRPEVQPERCNGEGACVSACPTGAISTDPWRVDLGKCIFCGLCAEVCPVQAIRMTQEFELAVHKREDLIVGAYGKPVTFSQTSLSSVTDDDLPPQATPSPSGQIRGTPIQVGRATPDKVGRRVFPMNIIRPEKGDLEAMGQHLKRRLDRCFKRSLHIRHLDSGSCNGCDWELTALLSPVHDLQRFGIDFVASPRHADVLLVTGTMTRNLTIAAIRTYRAMPRPRLVVAVGACGCSGGIFSTTYAGGGGTETVLPVDVYIPGCPPRPQALIYGLLLAVGRFEQKLGHASNEES